MSLPSSTPSPPADSEAISVATIGTTREVLLRWLREWSSVFARQVGIWLWIFCVQLSGTVQVAAQELFDPNSVFRLDESPLQSPALSPSLEARIAELERQNAALLAQQQPMPLPELNQLNQPNMGLMYDPRLLPGYDRQRGAFTLVRGSPEQPFELRADAWAEARYLSFSPNRDTWTDSTGATRPVDGFQSIEITRNIISLSGYALDPNLQYSAFIFSSTAVNQTVYAGWINYHFSDAFDVRAGNFQVPGTREWTESIRYTLGVERLMATTFFRPNVSPGVWVQGNLGNQFYYTVMLANSFNRASQGIDRVTSSKALGMTSWWEPTGDYGRGPSDMEGHDAPSLRLGSSMFFSEEDNQGFGTSGASYPEDTILRLSDGTPLFRPGALGPGIQLASARVNLWAIDAGIKYRGWSLSGEYLLRQLNGFEGSPTQPAQSSILDHGGLLQGGTMVIPRCLEAFGRTSFVNGPFGGGYEYGGGLNWYPYGNRDCRFTAEVLQISNCPAQNLLTGYRAGGSGTLLQVQWMLDL